MSIRLLSSFVGNRNFAAVRIKPPRFSLGLETIKHGIIKAEYAVRGDIVVKANEMRERLNKGESLPFANIIPCNIGNPFAVGKNSLTFPRQMIAAIEYPPIMKKGVFPDEVIDRAQKFLELTPGGLGAYSNSQGIDHVRRNVAKFIEKRDGFTSKEENIFLTAGASAAVRTILDMIVSSRNTGVLTPCPTYPLYTAAITVNDGQIIPYYLDENKAWDLDIEQLSESLRRSNEQGMNVKAMVVINPGNPTGKVFDEKTMRRIIEFCEDNQLMLIADEVYQSNTYNPNQPFVSFKKLVSQMKSCIPLISLHSISKGFFGECGHRGGYMELHNISGPFKSQLTKMMSIQLSPNGVGQLMVDVMCKPPKSQECKKIWDDEIGREIESLDAKSKILVKAVNMLPGIRSQIVDGSMYLFPRIEIPKKAIEESKKTKINGKLVKPDMFWALKLLEKTGIIVVPGSGLGQMPGTHHFRITFLPQANQMNEVVERLSQFQIDFMNKYSD